MNAAMRSAAEMMIPGSVLVLALSQLHNEKAGIW